MHDDRGGHYFSVVRKPIAGRLLLSRACFLFGFCAQSYTLYRENELILADIC